MKHFERLEDFCNKNDIAYNENIEKQFSMFFDLLIEKNKVMNLTAITEPGEVEIRHFIDSVESVPVICKLFPDRQDLKIVDIGTGAGFPGIPLSLVLKNTQFTLIDSLNKRIDFISDSVKQMGVNNVIAIHSRAEDAGQGKLREQFDICVSRAVANMAVLMEYMLPLVRVGGYCILYKSGEYLQELNDADYALKELGGNLQEVKSFQLPGTDIQRSLILIEKQASTPAKYPRKAGKPAKSPLIRK